MNNRFVRVGEHVTVSCTDLPADGGACHEYRMEYDPDNNGFIQAQSVKFQKGPIAENRVNGVQNEDLLAIVVDRLRSFQAGEFNCRENALAQTKLQEAMHWLNHRTADRKARNVEGTSDQ